MNKMNMAILDCKTLGNDISVEKFKKLGNLNIYNNINKVELEKIVKDLDIIITNKIKIDRNLIDNAKRLKMVAITATGYNNVDLEYAKKKGISVYNVEGYSTKSVSQHTLGMALSMICRIGEMDRYIKSGTYSNSQSMTRLDKPIRELSNMQWGIIGMGDIGREVARLAECFGATVKYNSLSEKDVDYERLELEELLKTSDVISIHTPLTEQTKGLIDYERLSMMNKNSIIINVARGGIIVEEDLARAISENIIGGACLDVFENEPLREDSPLIKLESDRILLTPHTAWSSVEARKQLIREVYLNVESFINGGDRKPL